MLRQILRRVANGRPPHGGAQLILLTVLVLLLRAPRVQPAGVDVEVLSLLYNKRVAQNLISALNAGINASFKAWKEKLKSEVNVTLTHLSSNNDSVVDKLREKTTGLWNRNKILVVLGPLGDKTVLEAYPYLERHQLVALAPYTGSSAVRGWREHIYFTMADPGAEVLALLRYALSQIRVYRLGFMYLKEVSFGDDEYKAVVEAMNRMGYKLSGVFALASTLDGEASESAFNDEWSKFVSEKPQAVIAFGSPIKNTEKFLTKLLTDQQTKNTYLLAPFVVQAMLMNILKKDRQDIKPFPGQLIFSGTNPLATDNSHQSIARFQENMRSYLRENKESHNFTEDNFLHSDIEGELMVYGWITGEMLFRTLSVPEWLKDRATFMKSLYNQRRYIVDDLLFGDYGGNCGEYLASLGAMCRCNQGGKTVYLKRVMNNLKLEVEKSGFMVLGPSECHTDLNRLQAPVSALVPFMNDDPMAMSAADEWYNGASYLVGAGQLGHSDRFFLHKFNANSKNVMEKLEGEEAEKSVAAVAGIVSESVLNTTSFVVFDPILLSSVLAARNERVIYLSATVEQQLFVIAKYVSVATSYGVHSVIRSKNWNTMEFVVNKSLGRFYTELATREVVGTEEEIAPKIPKEGDVILIGITSDDVDAIAKHLEENHDLRVYIMFTEFALRYQMFVKAFTNRSCASRLLFATNLPHWADEQTASETVRKFHSATNDKSKRTPLALMGFCVGRLIQEAVGSQQKVDGKALSDLFLGEVVLHADDMRYGPFVRGKCADIDFGDGGKCITNYGATEISVWSMERVLDPSVPLVEEPISEPLQYVDPGVWVLTSSMIGGMGATFCFLASIAATVMSLTRYFWGDARDNQYAPKVPTAPVTLIFTDIESSTALWAAHPELMPDVVATHHQLIRSLIVRYGCYEVKTVGDSFMIACRSPLAAVQLAGDLQRCFLHHDWGTTAFDDAYRDFEQQRAEEDVEYAPPTAHLDPEVYSQLWNGLRVRVGIHTGLCDIRRDEVTKGYDYYGRTSNMAARTESVANGGQVLLTRAAYLALSTVEREQVTVTSLGPVALRGEPEPVEMHQLDAVPGRTFAALRLDREIDENGLSEMNSPNGSTYNVPNELTHAGRQIRDSMKALLFVLTPPQSQRFLSILCGWWHVPYPRQDGSAWEKSHRADVIRQIAAKVSRIEECALRRRASTFKVFPARSGRSPSTICGIELAQSDTDSHISFGQNGGEEIKDADRISPRDTAASPASISMSSITYVVPFYKPGSPT